jgi:N-acetylmuramoyl-L-alanine amidase
MLAPAKVNLLFRNHFFKFEKPMFVKLINSTAKKRIFSLFLALSGSLLLFSQSNGELKTVVIDAGHGGKDPGAIGVTGVKEKDVALEVSLKVGEKIKKQYPNVKVIYTRSTDVFIGLGDRGKIANKANADLFISIHCNAVKDRSPKGTETFVLGLHKSDAALEVAKRENSSILMEEDYKTKYEDFDPSDPDSYIGLTLRQNVYLDHSIKLAKLIQDEFTYKLKRETRGVKQAGLMVLWTTSMPSVLVELGFLSNPEEEKYLNSVEGKEKFAESIFKAFSQYKSQIEKVNQSIDNTSNKDKTTELPIVKDTSLNTSNSLVDSTKSIVFRVQIATSGNNIEPISQNFKGLKNVLVEKDGKYYKYYIGNFYTFAETEEQKKVAVEKGYTSAFIVAYKNGQRITVSEALKEL